MAIGTTLHTNLSSSSSIKWEQFSRRVLIKNIVYRSDGGVGLAREKVSVGGWVKNGKEQGSFASLELNDGSCPSDLQVIVDSSIAANIGEIVHTGTCIFVNGELKKTLQGTKQNVELHVDSVLDIGLVDPAKYPLFGNQPLTLESLRDYVHLRPRTDTISAIARIRNALAYATHTFFQNHGFLHVHTPIITTTSDWEGSGEVFQVTTLFREADKLDKELKENPLPSQDDIKAAKLLVKVKREAAAQLIMDNASKGEINIAVSKLAMSMDKLTKLEKRSILKPGLPQKDGNIDYSSDFFTRPAFLVGSGQVQLETFACALSNVYTFGPTLRAEHSQSFRHLAEFWMVEPEIAFADLEDNMNCAETYVKFLCQWLLDNCLDDMQLMVKNFDKTAIYRLKLVTSTPFERITYTRAVKILENVTEKKFENTVEWGINFDAEHERYLTDVIFKKPVIVYNYPKGIKEFHMRINDDKKTVAAMDVLVPKIGELIGGGQREERYDVMEKRILESGMPLDPYEWYLDLRRYGTVKHSGFGLGFERMVLFATGLDNIQDVIPFPRYPGRADL
ncbi:hypothetical protein C5167_044749 [Papaver somniferum]|uniref:asparagine--tRNA ligase, cytoplasmic 1-like n=1 Tax=Papaver somniferum TaxID=3469 RepID=UPI000E6FFC22|nr:asparagine--tRNA ligase, cytoplasmic 1-like [Papaver somniferum]RZC90118.1 hypothetical protein C5167_044749 [Papaver somniferum]